MISGIISHQNDVRRHRLISISYILLLPCHGRGLKSFQDFHGGNTGSIPVGDASLETTTSSHSLENS